MTRRRRVPLSFRAEPELAARVERRAARQGVSVSDLLRGALERELGAPARRLFRPEHEALLFQARLCNRYLYRLLADAYGADEVKAGSAAVKQEVAAEVREIFRAIDEGEGG